MKTKIISTISASVMAFAFAASASANEFGPFEITLPEDTGGVTLNDRDLNWNDQNAEKDGTQVDVVVTLRGNKSGIDVRSTDASTSGPVADMGSWSFGRNDVDVDFRVVYVQRVGDGIQVQLVVNRSNCHSRNEVPCDTYTGKNKNKLFAKTNFPVGTLVTLGLEFNDSDGNNRDVAFGNNNLPQQRDMYRVGSGNVLQISPTLVDLVNQ
ncbi:MAG: hypothetical protein AAF830_13380 [Pseudomonadota bacterium]